MIWMRRQRRRGHPILFVLTLGTLGAAVVNGDVGVAVLMVMALVGTLL